MSKWTQCNVTLEDENIHEEPIVGQFTFHTVGLIASAAFAVIAIAVSFFLIYMHATHYLKPFEQRHIIRILFMVPVYAAVSFLSYKYYMHSIYFDVLRDCYEAFAIASFFSLLCAYVAPDLHAQKEYFRTITPRKWIWPLPWFQKCFGGENGALRTPRSGLTYFNVIWVCIFQYCFIRVFMTVVAVLTQATGRYCIASLSPAFAHVWIMAIEAIAVSIAMYCIIQFYVQIRLDIQQHKPILKVTAIKLVIFLSFWQTLIVSFLTSTGALKATNKIQTPDIKIGIPAMLLCVEMAIFAVFHLWAFSWRPYTRSSKEHMSESVPGDLQVQEYKGGFMGIRALLDSFNPWDLVKAVGRAARWLFMGRKNRHTDSSYALTRKGTENSDITSGNQKFSNEPTAYLGTGRPHAQKPPYYNGGDQSEGETLLANSQSMPMSRPPVIRVDSSPYRSDSGNQDDPASDIGVATTTYGGRPPPQQQQQPYQPYPANGQETGIVAAPYPHSAYQAEDKGRQGQVAMPYFPPPPGSGATTRGGGNMF